MSKIPCIDDLENRANASALAYMDANPHRWPTVMAHEGPFLFESNPDIVSLMIEIDKFSGSMHSGASIAMTMRFLRRKGPLHKGDSRRDSP